MIADYLRQRVEALETRSNKWDDKVSELVRALLPNGDCTIERVAEHLACDRRTIHRHLAERGTSFSTILDTERADLVVRLIEDGDRPLKEMAALLGFSAQWRAGFAGVSAAASPNGAAMTASGQRSPAGESASFFMPAPL